MSSEKKIGKATPVLTLLMCALKRGLWMPLTYSVLNIVIISFSVNSFRFSGATERGYEYLLSRLDSEIGIHFISIIIAAITGCVMFSYLNRVSSASFMHGLPVSRTGIFFAHYGAGAILLLIPSLVSSIYMGCYVRLPLYGLLFFVTNALYSIGVFSFAVLVCQLSANTLGGLIFTAFGLATPIICEGFIVYLMNENLFGYAGQYNGLYVSRLLYLLPSDVPTLYGLIYVGAIILFTVFGLLLFKKRAIELAGDLIAFTKIRTAVTYICGILAGMCAYLIFDANLFMFVLFGIICAVLVNFAIRKKFTVKGAVIPSVTVISTAVVIFIVFLFDLTGFERRIPAPEDVESVRVYNRFYKDETILLGEEVAYRLDMHEPISAPEDIEKVTALHKDLLRNKNFLSTGEDYRYYDIEYTLKNGDTLKRNYPIFYKRNAEAFAPVTELYEFKRHRHEILENNLSVTSAGISGIYGKQVSFDNSSENVQRLYEAMVADISAMKYSHDHDIHNFAASSEIYVRFDYYHTKACYMDGSAVPQYILAQHDSSVTEAIYPCYTNTIAVIKEIAPEMLDIDSELSQDTVMTIEYSREVYDSENGMYSYTERYETTEITDSEAIREIVSEVYRMSEEVTESVASKNYYYIHLNAEGKYYTDYQIYGESEVLEKYIRQADPLLSSTTRYPINATAETAVSVWSN